MTLALQHMQVLARKKVAAGDSPLQAELKTAAIAYYRLESSGADSTSNSLDLTEFNTPAYVSATAGNGADLESSNSEYFSHADNALFDLTDDFVLTCVVNLESKTAGQIFVGKFDTSGNQRSYLLGYESGADRFWYVYSSNGVASNLLYGNVLGSPSASTPYFIDLRHGSSTVTLKITALSSSSRAGSGDSTGAAACFNSSASFDVGAGYNGSLSYTDGVLDEVGVFNDVSEAALDEYFLQLKAGNGLYDTWS